MQNDFDLAVILDDAGNPIRFVNTAVAVNPKHRDYIRSALDIAWHIYAVNEDFDPERATDDQRADWLVLCARTNGFDLESDLAFTGYATTLFDAAERYNTVRLGQHGSVTDS